MEICYAAVLGVIQGLTEFLPVSSSGHLVLLQNLFGLREPENTLCHFITQLMISQKSHKKDGFVKSSRCKARASFKAGRRNLLKPAGAILRNEAYFSYVAMIYPVKSAPPSRVARI